MVGVTTYPPSALIANGELNPSQIAVAEDKAIVGQTTGFGAAKAISGDTTLDQDGAQTVTKLTIASAVQGDILYHNGTAWVRLPAGTSGHFLKTQGAGANPIWASGGTASDLSITNQAQGDVLYFNGTNWVRLPAGTSGQFLKTLGAAQNPAWATVADSANLLTTLVGDSGVITYAGNSGLGAVTNCKVDVSAATFGASDACLGILEIVENSDGQTNEYEVEVNGSGITTTKFIDESNSPVASIKKGIHFFVILPAIAGTDDVLVKEKGLCRSTTDTDGTVNAAVAEYSPVLADWMLAAHTYQVNARNNGSATATKYSIRIYKISIELAQYLINTTGYITTFPTRIYDTGKSLLDRVRMM